jgi:hypothetical protein
MEPALEILLFARGVSALFTLRIPGEMDSALWMMKLYLLANENC